MIPESLKQALRDFREGRLPERELLRLLHDLPYEDLDFAKVDHHRELRHGMPEVILGQGKTPDEVRAISEKLLERSPNLLVTRASEAMFEAVRELSDQAEHFPRSGAVRVWGERSKLGKAKIAVVCAGTSDIPVAEEATVTAEVMGNEVDTIYDVGVAGIHRLLSKIDRIQAARVVICCAGMEGALPSALGGLVSIPVIAVPTSVGYGASFNGLSALLGMLNSCSSNVSVVNIDNGFGAAYVATLINRL
jgi:NCAIR mutase (PurE)-related protein